MAIKTMRKFKNNAGVLTIQGDQKEKFHNQACALMSAQLMAIALVNEGYLVTTYLSSEVKKFEVSVHLEDKQMPKLSNNIKYTRKEITSHEYWSSYFKQVTRVRVITFYFTY